MRFGGKTPGRAFRRRIGCCEHWLPSTAGEVGDGPDQGHSGGADSVPPAPDSKVAPRFCKRSTTRNALGLNSEPIRITGLRNRY